MDEGEGRRVVSRGTVRALMSAVAGFAAMYGVLAMNHSGLVPGASSDSVAYLTAAESLVRRADLRIPVTSWNSPDSDAVLAHFPPGLPLLISLPMHFHVRAQRAALWVMAASSGLSVAAAFMLGADMAGLAAGSIAAALLLLTPVYVKMNFAIWSEPSYIALTMVMLWMMAKRPTWAAGYGFLAAAGVAVRYVGIAGSATAVTWAALQGRTLKDRVVGAAVAGAPSAIFLLWWRSYVAASGGAIRRLGFYPRLGPNLTQLREMFAEWLVPGSWHGNGWAAMALVALGLIVVAGSVRSGSWKGRRPWAVPAWIYGAVYVVVVAASRLFADYRIPFDARIFSPLLVLATVAVAVSAVDVARAHGRLASLALAGVGLGWGASMAADIHTGVEVVNQQGRFYTYRGWVSDQAIGWLKNRSRPYATVYSNEPALVYYHTGRHAKMLPDMGEDLAAFGETFKEHPGAVFLARPPHVRNVPEGRLVAMLGLIPAVRTELGVVYVPRPGPAMPAH